MKEYRLMCQYCGKIFYTTNKKAKYCSDSCVGESAARQRLLKQNEKNKEKYEEISNREIVEIAKDREWEGITKEGYYYHRELDSIYGVLVECCFCHKKYYVSQGEFDRHQGNFFCSHQCFCNNKVEWIDDFCLNCGKVYKKNIKDTFEQFCSDECKKEFDEKIKDNKLPALINLRQSTCINCHEQYWNIKNSSVQYCSLECKSIFGMKKDIKEKICEECGNHFFTHHNGRFCSTECASRNHLKKNGGFKTRPTVNGMKGKKQTLSSREKQSKSLMKRMRENSFYANSYNKGFYNFIPHFVRSTWEANFALILMYLNRDYKFEAKDFKLEEGHRLMLDFYDVKRNVFYEIKGWHIDDSEEKLELFKQKYPNIKVHIINRKKYIRIYQYFGKKIQLIECFPNYNIDKGLNLMSLDDFNSKHISFEEHQKLFGDYEHNQYKTWKIEYDKKLGL